MESNLALLCSLCRKHTIVVWPEVHIAIRLLLGQINLGALEDNSRTAKTDTEGLEQNWQEKCKTKQNKRQRGEHQFA